MDPFSFPPFAAVLGGASALITSMADTIAGAVPTGVAVLIAIAIATLAVRAALIPVGLSSARAQVARARLAPRIRELQKRHAKEAPRLASATQELYRAEGVSPFAGMLPSLFQVPIVSVVYGVFTRVTIAGQTNALLAHTVLGTPLGASFAGLAAAGAVGQLVLPLSLLVVIAAIALLSRCLAIRSARLMDPTAPDPTRLARVLSWLPLLAVVFAALVPVAASVYLAVSMAWTGVERTLATRRWLTV
ncbi:membrane protein insertase YidC [Planctomonas sp. JC2975]|uniref:YidC/Oxa1 family membrane protein insertase n=1 Tax=Planctomonas sp. JC2975 TaxID=2729626 RepID=UPI001475C1D0|nr:membrane protein insertase YidC [Planctomonas sp. JC2975]NNC11472.1 membrane protein insertase YidC [Planctomonas sp. JC2975]